MSYKDETNYAVRIQYTNGEYFPDGDIVELDWLSEAAARRTAGTVYATTGQVKNHSVVAIEIIDAEYNVIQREEVL